MNTRSLSFRLVAWYASVLTLVFLLLGAVTFAAVANYLQANLRDDQVRRARQIADTLLKGVTGSDEPALAASVESLYAPEANDRFIRVTRGGPGGTASAVAMAGAGRVLFQSGAPHDRSFDPAAVPRLVQLPRT